MYSVASVMKLVDTLTNICEMTFISYRVLVCEIILFAL